MAALTVRTMTAADLARTLDWAAEEGWNPGIADGEAFLAADPSGFLMGFLGDEPIAGISAVRYGPDFGFLGLYLCRARYRGNGYGWALWQAAMAQFGNRTVGLDGVMAQQANYAKSGFAAVHRHIRYAGTARHGAGRPDPAIVVVPAEADAPLAIAVAAYDRVGFPVDRSSFVRAWIGGGGRLTLAATGGGRVTGYGTIRPCRTGYKVGPLFADDPATAERLLAALTAPHAGAPVFLDVPEPNRAAVALAEGFGMTPSFETARMVRGTVPDLPLARIFGVTTLELG